jgi:molybdate transport system ATP-binding protein
MSGIEVRLAGKLGDFSLQAEFAMPGQGVTGLFGPSGCGKSTILRCLAGLTRLKRGHVAVEGKVWQDSGTFLAPHRRSIGFVFQEPCLFAHLSVMENLCYGWSRSKEKREELNLDSVVKLMGIGSLLRRATQKLSGGEMQRIAIARALLSQPRLLLMDEPLSALDHDSREEILLCLEDLHRKLALPVIYVTHDISELERFADHLILMAKDGYVCATGNFATLTTHLSLPIAQRRDAAAALDVVVVSHDRNYDITTCRIGAAPLLVPGDLGPVGVMRRVLILASDVGLVRGERPRGTSVLNILPARILSAATLSNGRMTVLLALDNAGVGGRLLAGITRKSWDELVLQPGDQVQALIKGMAVNRHAALTSTAPLSSNG